MSDCDGTCGGETCGECHQHVHPWDGSHAAYCWPGARRALTDALNQFTDALRDARAVRSGSGTYHATDCHNVRTQLTFGHNAIDNPDPAAWHWRPWAVEHRDRVTGYTARCCTPDITVQPPAPRRRIVRLTGIGWPTGNGQCARGRLPQSARQIRTRHAQTGTP